MNESHKRPLREYVVFYVSFLLIIGGALGGLYFWENHSATGASLANSSESTLSSTPQVVLMNFTERLKAGDMDGALDLVSADNREIVRSRLDELNRDGRMDVFLKSVNETAGEDGAEESGDFVINGPVRVYFMRDSAQKWIIASLGN